jgi:glutamate-1-semialdehyde 2,1-aminomutase
MTVMGKIITGGLPGGVVAGREDIMRLFEYTGDAHHDRFQRVAHQGTFNANPLSAAAGIATLRVAATGQPQAHADAMAVLLRDGMNCVLDDLGVAGYVYGDSSVWHCYLTEGPGVKAASRADLYTDDPNVLKGIPGRVVQAFQKNLQIRGVDILSYTGGVTSSAHTEADIQHTLGVFREVMGVLVEAGIVGRVAGA